MKTSQAPLNIQFWTGPNGASYIRDQWDRVLAIIPGGEPGDDVELLRANIQLFAAAPELLEACKVAYNALPPACRPAKALAAAIAKAEGRKP